MQDLKAVSRTSAPGKSTNKDFGEPHIIQVQSARSYPSKVAINAVESEVKKLDWLLWWYLQCTGNANLNHRHPVKAEP